MYNIFVYLNVGEGIRVCRKKTGCLKKILKTTRFAPFTSYAHPLQVKLILCILLQSCLYFIYSITD